MTSDDFRTKITKVKTALEAIFVKKADRSHISYGQVDSTSTSTAFTATVTGLTSLTDGATVMLRNGYITSAEGFTLNVNGLGAKPVYNSMADATRDTTIFNINYTMLFVYDSTRIEGGCWICYRGYNSDKDTNTIGYQIRTNSSTYTATDKFVRYRLLLEVDNGHYMPVNTSTSTSGTASKSSAMNTREFKIGGRIMYYGTTATVSANTQIAGIAYLWTQINLVLGYSFSNSSSGPSLTTGEPVYMIAKPSTTNKGMAKLNTPYYTQSLPSTADGLIYIYLGQATDATHIELVLDHPIYEYYGGGIRLYREYYDSGEVDTLLSGKSDIGHTHTIDSSLSSTSTNPVQNKVINSALAGKSDTGHTHTKSQITDFPTIPDVSGKIDTAGTGLSKSGTTLNHSNSITALTTATLKKVKYDAQGHITGVADVTASDLPSHTHNYSTFSGSYNDLTNKPTIPSATSDLTNDGNGEEPFLTHSDISAVGITNSYEDLDDKPTIPTASTTTPSADTTSGSYGSGTSYARSNHTHPKSSLYAEANHTHSQYANIEDIPTHLENLTLSDDEGISSEDGHLLINNQTSGDYIGFADDLLTYDTANSVLNYNSYELATVNDIPTTTSQLTNNSGFLTSHQSLTPTRVYNCTSWNSSYIDTTASNQLMLYKLGDSLYFLRYFLTTKTLVYSTTDYNINSDAIPSNYRPEGDRTFYISTNKETNARIVIKSTGKITISAGSNNQIISTAGTLTYWW